MSAVDRPSRLIAAAGMALLVVGVVIGVVSWSQFMTGSTPIYRSPGTFQEIGAVKPLVPTSTLTPSVSMRLADVNDHLLGFELTVRVASSLHLTRPPVVGLAFAGDSRVALHTPMEVARSGLSGTDWFDVRGSTGLVNRTVLVSEPPTGPPERVGLEDALGLPADRVGARLPWYTFDGRTLVVRFVGQFVMDRFRLQDRSRLSYALPALLPAGIEPALAGPQTARGVPAIRYGDNFFEDQAAVPTFHEVELLQPSDPFRRTGGGQLGTEVPADVRVDYAAPTLKEPDALLWQRDASAEPMFVRLSYVSRSGEQRGQAAVFRAGIGLGAAASLLILMIQIMPWLAIGRRLVDFATLLMTAARDGYAGSPR